MVESTEVEKGEGLTKVDSEETTELAHAEALLEEEATGANDGAVDSGAEVAASVEAEEENVEEVPEAEETEDAEADAAVSAEAAEEDVEETAEDEEAEGSETDVASAEVAAVSAEAAEEDVKETTEDEETEDSEAEVAASVEAEEEDVGEAAEDEETEQEPERPEGVDWFVVHSYSGYENKVKKNLEHRIESMGMQDQIFQVVVPTEEEVELRDGQRRTTERRVFPGYILVEMLMNDDTWYVVRNTPGVTDFVRSGTKPIPLRQEEVDKILKRMEAEAPKIKVSFREGQKVRIVDGPFEDFMGTVDAIDTDRARARVLVNMFGRETPVEVDFLQVERV
jgi:transcriptional antiterminator NusG